MFLIFGDLGVAGIAIAACTSAMTGAAIGKSVGSYQIVLEKVNVK
ncbi:MAG: hypothetical protein V7L29_19840 [Nostoc sp.]